MSIFKRLLEIKEEIKKELAVASLHNESIPSTVLFFVFSTGKERAEIVISRGKSFEHCWQEAEITFKNWRAKHRFSPVWLRVELVNEVRVLSWLELKGLLNRSKRNYFRYGLSFDDSFNQAILEHEIYANALIYDNKYGYAVPNSNNLAAYGRRRFKKPLSWPSEDNQPVYLFKTRAFFTDGKALHPIEREGRNSGYRVIDNWGADYVGQVIDTSTDYLVRQVKDSGEYHYGWFPCFDRPIPTYNALRHASSTYALIEGWEVTQEKAQKAAIERALNYLQQVLIKEVNLPDGTPAAFLVDVGNEIKLGGNAVCILAMAKYTEVTGDNKYLELMEKLALGILYMQNPDTGQLVHVLSYPDLSVKEEHRIIYYDGEAAFGLMRLYGITKDPRWINAVKKSFEYFIEKEHWRAHDHWLSYCVNELTLYDPDPKYYQFGLDNVRDHLDFVLNRLTTFPTLLELMMAAQRMITRLQETPDLAYLLEGFDVDKFYRALEHRARYLMNGFFYPEIAMFFKNPARIVGGFFIRHHTFRVRIDDVEHYLSGLVAYRKYLLAKSKCSLDISHKLNGYSADDLCFATGGKWHIKPESTDWLVDSVCVSSPYFQEGALLCAYGKRGKAGVQEAAVFSLANRYHIGAILCEDPQPYQKLGVPILVVADIRKAVFSLGRYARQRYKGVVLGVTGSAGKTTMTALLDHVLSADAAVSSSQGSANLPFGIAWNMGSMSQKDDFWVVEMAIGNMPLNSELVKPNIAVVTNIAPAHLKFHNSLKEIAEKKSKIFSFMEKGGWAVIYSDMPYFDLFCFEARSKGLHILTFGESELADARFISLNKGVMRASMFGREMDLDIGVNDFRHALNVLSVSCILKCLGTYNNTNISRFNSFNPVSGRGNKVEVSFGESRFTLINDAYNANPLSMRMALNSFSKENRERVLIIGDMLELGSDSAKYHINLARDIERVDPDLLIMCGDEIRNLYDFLEEKEGGLTKNRYWFKSAEEIKEALSKFDLDGKVVLLKASNSVGLHKLFH